MPALLAFVNDVCEDMPKAADRPDAFLFEEQDRFPVDRDASGDESPLGLIAGEGIAACAVAVADEIVRLLADGVVVRDRDTGVRRPITAGDIAILFRTRDSHREFEQALEQRRIRSHVYKGLGFFDADEIKDVRALLWYLADPESDLRAAAMIRSRFVRASDEALRLLAPQIADTLRNGLPVERRAQLSVDDVGVLVSAHESCRRWLALVDRIPPAELLDIVLRESAYGLWLRGSRFEQAYENLKKLRMLIRRVQNRGYATVGRIALHLDHLAVGDEANAWIDAANAVSLMTIHAAKGLEFPVVFLVSLTKGTAERRDPIRISADVALDDPSVAVGDFLSDADVDAMARDREETKRLVYVALTRARDRMCLAAALEDGRLEVGRGSLAEVMPPSLLALFLPEANAADRWVAESGYAHHFARIEASDNPGPVSTVATVAPEMRPVDRAPMRLPRRTRTASQLARIGEPESDEGGLRTERIVGLLVHRLVQRFGLRPVPDETDWSSIVPMLLRREEQLEVGDGTGLVQAVTVIYRTMCARPDIRELHETGEWLHEVPFSLRDQDDLVRGTIDCLVRLDGKVVVLELKTGRPRPEDHRQVELYCRAAGRLFPSSVVESCLIYPTFIQRS